MLRFTLLLAIAFVLNFQSSTFAQPDYGSAIAKADDERDAKLAAAAEAYRKAVARANADYRRRIEALKNTAARAGDIDTANNLNELLKTLPDEAPEKPEAVAKGERFFAGSKWHLDGRPDVWIRFAEGGRVATFVSADTGLWTTRDDGSLVAVYGPEIGSSIQRFVPIDKGRKAKSGPEGNETREWVRVD